jgi:hypothetical protein
MFFKIKKKKKKKKIGLQDIKKIKMKRKKIILIQSSS